ncbi:hypothetical protein BGX27_001978 [Mortierella sp. AM989]|nr:hypothetical protein BGX27_001978 [Mortierella sp. AM989]
MSVPSQGMDLSLPTKFTYRPFSISLPNQRLSSRRLFREGSIGSKSWKQKDIDQSYPGDSIDGQSHRDVDTENGRHVPKIHPPGFLPHFGRGSMNFSPSSALLRPHIQSPQAEGASPPILDNIHDSFKNDECLEASRASKTSRSTKLIEISTPNAPPISAISVRMPRDLATHSHRPELSSTDSLSSRAQYETILEPIKSSHGACMAKDYGSCNELNNPLRLPSEQYEALVQNQYSSSLAQPKGHQLPRKAIDSPSLGQRTTAEFFQQASIHGHIDNPTLRVVTVQGGYYIDSRGHNSCTDTRDQKNNSVVLHQGTANESHGNHGANSNEVTNHSRSLSDTTLPSNYTQDLDPAQFVATMFKKKESHIESLSRELQLSQDQLKRSSSRLQDLERDHQELVSAYNSLKGKLTERITSIQEQYIGASSLFEDVTQEARKYRDSAQAIQEDLQGLIGDRVYLLKKQEELACSFSEIQRRSMEEKKTLISQIEELQIRCDLEQSLCGRQTKEIEELHQRCDAYQLSVQQLEMNAETLAQKITETAADLDSRKDLVQDLEVALVSSKSEIEVLSQSIDVERESLLSRIRVADDLLHKAQRDLARSVNELSEARVSVSALEKSNNELVELTRKPCTVTTGVGTNDDPRIDSHLLMTHLQSRVDDLKANNDDLNKALSSLKTKQTLVIGEKGDLQEQLRKSSALNIASKHANDDLQKQVRELQKMYNFTQQKLADSESEKSSLYTSISGSLSEHTAHINSTIQECIDRFGETRRLEVAECQNQTQEIQRQVYVLKAKLEEKTNALNDLSKEKESMLVQLSEKSELLTKSEIGLLSWRAKLQLMEADQDKQRQQSLKDQDESQKIIQSLEERIRQLQEVIKGVAKDKPTQLPQSIEQVRRRIDQEQYLLF